MAELFDIVKGNVKAMKKSAARIKPILKQSGVTAIALFMSASGLTSCAAAGGAGFGGGYSAPLPAVSFQTGFVDRHVSMEQQTENGYVRVDEHSGGIVDGQTANLFAEARQTDAYTQRIINDAQLDTLETVVDSGDQLLNMIIRWREHKQNSN